MRTIRTNFIGYSVDNLSSDEFIEFCNEAVLDNTYNYIAVLNANKIYLMNKYPEILHFMNNASLILPENAINIGMRLINKPLVQRNMGGIHMMQKSLELADVKGYSVYFLGATEYNINKLILNVSEKYSNIKIKGFANGYFDKNSELSIVNEIQNVHPNFLFIGLGSPLQELFIMRNFMKFNANIVLGVGGSFKVIAGLEKLAPNWTKYGLEWIYRSFQDPKKVKRYLIVNSFFLLKFISYIFKAK